MIFQVVTAVSGLLASFLFIFGLKRMASPITAHSGIAAAGGGMVLAVVASFFYLPLVVSKAAVHLPVNVTLALVALALGIGGAWWSARKVAMTAMPQTVALYNGMGGGAAAAMAAVELLGDNASDLLRVSLTVAGALIGSISLTGSVVAWAKLDGKIGSAWRWKGQRLLNAVVFLVTVTLAVSVAIATVGTVPIIPLTLFFLGALAFGVLMTLPIGGADMPVVISLYNAFTGLAVALEGYAMQNPALMIAGTVVGSAGILLTMLMAKAMNRSIANVLFSNFGEISTAAQADVHGSVKATDPGDAAVAMRYAASVVIVPGYGLAVAQAQQKLYELVKMLQAAGVEVKFAMHPVAGRMPGHMNVLLAEAGIPYDIIFDMEDINDDFPNTDVALVIGANDVVNPAARTDKSSPVYGMPILNVDRARQVYVIKRGQGKGYAGVENLLFYADNCNMVYGDAQAVLVSMIQALKDLGS